MVGYRNEEELAQRIAPYSYRVLKRDCLDLPEKIYEFHDVDMTPEQEKAYDEMLNFATTQLSCGAHVSAPMAMVQVQKRHQILLGHVRDEDGVVRHVKSNRVRALMEILTAHSGKAIVWAPYDECIREISETIRKEFGASSLARFWGGNSRTREDEEKQFKSDPRCRFMVSTQMAGGAGRTWIAANLVIYFGDTFNLEHRLNSEDRAHRAGQRNVVTYVNLRVRGTVEDKITGALRRKLDVATAIMRDGPREWLV